MPRYILKDSQSKSEIFSWLKSGTLSYAADSSLNWNDEDALCAQFFKSISGSVSTPTGNLNLRTYKVRGRGPGAAEKKLGADGIALVQINTPSTQLSGYFLFQAKKAYGLDTKLRGSTLECKKMLNHSAASYLLVLLPDEVKMVGAMAVGAYVAGADPRLEDTPYVNFPRFIVEHLLQGLMLEPLEKIESFLTPELKNELRHVVTLVGGVNQQIENAMMKIDTQIRELELDIENQID